MKTERGATIAILKKLIAARTGVAPDLQQLLVPDSETPLSCDEKGRSALWAAQAPVVHLMTLVRTPLETQFREARCNTKVHSRAAKCMQPLLG